MKQIEENRKRLIPIIECVMLCGQQEIALRGHRDYGPICFSSMYIILYYIGSLQLVKAQVEKIVYVKILLDCLTGVNTKEYSFYYIVII